MPIFLQLAVLGETTLRARVKVWWKLNAAYYSSVVESVDPVRYRHTVFYDEGDVESIPLWVPDQLVCQFYAQLKRST